MTRLSDILAPVLPRDPEITGLTADSRSVRPGDLFAALPGSKVDGRDFIKLALAQGASAILASSGAEDDPRLADIDVPLVTDPEPRRRFAQMAARFHGRQPAVMVAATGTNGKTSVVNFTRQIWATLGRRAASLGTLGVIGPDRHDKGSLTTPDPVSLHRSLAQLAGEGVTHVALEASSHGLDQFRLDGVILTAAAFTNLTRDHLDYHGGMEGYWQAKLRLFTDLLPPGATAVINADTPEAASLTQICLAHRLRVLSFGAAGEDIRIEAIRPTTHGQDLSLVVAGEQHQLHLPLAGTFQASNALAALGLVIASGADAAAALATLPHLQGIPGRLQKVAVKAQGAPIYVDYAHTPDALETVLTALRPHATGKLVAVFGCGGDRDPGKRPQMGRIAAMLADRVYVTDDNPRGEEPAAIRAAILADCPGGIEVGDRRQAILTAVLELEAGDILVIAGKGHETGQIVGNRVLPFDDAHEARRAVGETL